MTDELRCDNKLHGTVIDDNTVEIKCDSRFCGAKPGIVVLHRWNLKTKELVGTRKFRDPSHNKERK